MPVLVKLSGIFSKIFLPLLSHNGSESNSNGKTFADSYHGKVVPLEAAKQLVTIQEDIRIENTFFYNCTYFDDNAFQLCKKKDKRGYAYEKLKDRDYVWNPASKRFKPSAGQQKYSCSVPEQ